jgi:serine/threonine protein kinase
LEGTPFGRYRLVELLGQGGMGEVWRAYDSATDRVVAIKVLHSHFAQDRTFEQRFRREAHAAAALNNQHVIPIHNYGEIDGKLFVDMRLIDGRDLAVVLANGPLEPLRAVGIIEQIAKALHAAHRVDLVHRDVKPSNILLAEDDFAYLIDFGIARAASDTAMTSAGATIGTWAYMAPERFSTGQTDARSDVYALACVLHECLTGEKPFPGDTLERLVAGHMFSPPPQPSAIREGLPPTFDDVIAVGLAKDPDHRYPSTVEFARAARTALTTSIPRSAPTQEPKHGTITALPHAATMRVDQYRAKQHDHISTSAPTQQRPPTPNPPLDPAPPPGPSMAAQPLWRRRRLLIGAAATAVIAVIAGVGLVGIRELRPTALVDQRPTLPVDASTTASSSAASSSASTSAQAQPTDYTALLIKATDIDAPEVFTASPPIQNPNGKAGVATAFSNPDGTHVIGDTILVLPDPSAAASALDSAKTALGGSVNGTPGPADVGSGGTTVSGNSPDGSKSVTVLLFTQGRAFTVLEFDGPANAVAPPDFVTDVGQKQVTVIKDGISKYA